MRKGRPRFRAIAGRLVAIAILAFAAVSILVPLIWIFRGAIATTDAEIFRLPPTLAVRNPGLDNFNRALTAEPLSRFFINSTIVALAATVAQLFTCSTAAYAFARLSFRGKKQLFAIVIGSMMVPITVTIVPQFILMARFELTDTLWALILPGVISGFGIFLLRQHFLAIPIELEEAAKIDGAGHWRIFFRIVMPLSGPALATLGILTFTFMWNDLLMPLVMIRSTENQTLPVGLVLLIGQFAAGAQGATIAAIAMMVAPVLIVFLILQRHIVRSIASSGLKF
jgi:multiple sugar transport system permease protein